MYLNKILARTDPFINLKQEAKKVLDQKADILNSLNVSAHDFKKAKMRKLLSLIGQLFNELEPGQSATTFTSNKVTSSLTTLDQTRDDVLKLLVEDINKRSSEFSVATAAFSKAWEDFYHFKLSPAQERRYFKVLLEQRLAFG